MNLITLHNNQSLIFDDNKKAYRVVTGSVLVYFAAQASERELKRYFACEMFEGDVIPGFNYSDCFLDADPFQNSSMYMQLASINNALLEPVENNNGIRYRFLEKLGIRCSSDEQSEKEWSMLIGDRYADEMILDLATTKVIKNREAKAHRQIAEDISEYVSGGMFSKFSDAVPSGDRLYDTVALFCKNLKISCASYEKVRTFGNGLIRLKDISAASGFNYRTITLEDGWFSKDIGDFIAYMENSEEATAVFSGGFGKYTYQTCSMKKPERLTKEIAAGFSKTADYLYKPFPEKSMGVWDLIRYLAACIRGRELLMLILMMIVEMLLGLLIPILNRVVYDTFIPGEAVTGLFAVGTVIVIGEICTVLFSLVKRFVNFRLFKRAEYSAQAALFDRFFSADVGELKQYESGALTKKMLSISEVLPFVQENLFLNAAALIFSLFYLFVMGSYSGPLCGAAVVILIVYLLVSLLISYLQFRFGKEKRTYFHEESSLLYQLLSAVDKLLSSNSGARGFRKYFRVYSKRVEVEKKISIATFVYTIWDAMMSVGSTLLFYALVSGGAVDISLGRFIAFTSVFSMLFSYFRQLVSASVNLSTVFPSFMDLMSLLKMQPESRSDGELIADLKGKIDIQGVTFAYPGGRNILEDLSLSIAPGEYVGIVGPSGCGKSTLLKLLLGFEQPNIGRIYYDDHEMGKLNITELRRNFGVVLQKSEIIPGTIYNNITMTKPDATSEEVLEAVKLAGFEEDINRFPLGLGTILNPVSAGISGGQVQRIAIARALVSKPKILFFDEATSALDNATQKIVCQSIENLNVTKIVIAHRLSTIMSCDRIIVIDKGSIVEQGTFDELMQKKGFFYRLAERQLV